MLPVLLGKGIQHHNILTDTFINTYIADRDKPEEDNSLLIRYAMITGLPEWVDNYSSYMNEDESFMVTYPIPDEAIKNYSNFLLGDYSKLTDDYKRQVLTFWEASSDTLLYGVLYRSGTDIRKLWEEKFGIDLDIVPPNMEYWKPPSLKQEIFGMTGD